MKIYSNQLVNINDMIKKAKDNKYAVGHFNVNNLEWAKSLLEGAQENNSPIILGVSEGAARYMGGFHTVVGMINGLITDLKITVPVALHLDHGSTVKVALSAIEHGFSSVMYDGSALTLDKNIENTIKVVKFAQEHEVSVEAEVGTIGGEEDGMIGSGEIASLKDALKMRAANVDIIAAGIGNIHGLYPENWPGLSFKTLEEISKGTNRPLVLHGGSGIPLTQIKKAVSLGICKINVNTECQIAFCHAVNKYFKENHQNDDKGYDPRKFLQPGSDAIKRVFKELIILFGCINKA